MKTHPRKVASKGIKSFKIVRIEINKRAIKLSVTNTFNPNLHWNEQYECAK